MQGLVIRNLVLQSFDIAEKTAGVAVKMINGAGAVPSSGQALQAGERTGLQSLSSKFVGALAEVTVDVADKQPRTTTGSHVVHLERVQQFRGHLLLLSFAARRKVAIDNGPIRNLHHLQLAILNLVRRGLKEKALRKLGGHGQEHTVPRSQIAPSVRRRLARRVVGAVTMLVKGSLESSVLAGLESSLLQSQDLCLAANATLESLREDVDSRPGFRSAAHVEANELHVAAAAAG